jgi:hypothetical protein
MAIKWNDLKHKSSPEVRANLKREAETELERIGFQPPAAAKKRPSRVRAANAAALKAR